jgi:hypothetical protein
MRGRTPLIGSLRRAVPALGLFSAAAGLWVLSACNVFSPIASDDDKDLTYRGLILKGNKAINDEEYADAAAFFAQAKAMDPRGSEAYLYTPRPW